ncbi:MAG TPA: hypothetical protein VK369_11805, partial [Segetibacter sp.]|nr:hypothetical protein [Segetibacter sp.]
IMKGRKEKFKRISTIQNYLRAFSSYDEVFRTVFRKDVHTIHDTSVIRIFENITGITNDDLSLNMN